MPRERRDACSGQLAQIKKTIRAQTVLAHCSGLSCGARRAPTGKRQQQRQHPAQFTSFIAPYASSAYLGLVDVMEPVVINWQGV
jgi:hypothetical protein